MFLFCRVTYGGSLPALFIIMNKQLHWSNRVLVVGSRLEEGLLKRSQTFVKIVTQTHEIKPTKPTGCPTKHDPHGFCLISLATNMLEIWDIIYWKGGIPSFVWSTKTFLYDIREPRYKQIKMGYQISKCLNMGKYSVWKSDTAAIYA